MIMGGAYTAGFSSKRPKVSIITVVLNGINFIEAYLNNIAPFLNENVELIMVDGSSTDGTLEVLQRNTSQIDYWCSEPDAGIYDAMNKGVKLAKGEWLYFMGVDDSLLEGFSEIVPQLTDPSTIYYGNVISYGKLLAKEYDNYFLTKLNICHQAIFYPRQVFSKYSYDTRYLVYADYHLNLQCWQDPDFEFQYCNQLIARFPDGGFSSYTVDSCFEKDRDRLFKNYLGLSAYYRYVNRTKGALNMFKQIIAG